MEERRFAEFFAGIGLVRLALEPLGWKCVFANDISEEKAELYREQFGGSELDVRDIRAVKAKDLPKGLSLVTASFPCIDLSPAGNRNGLDGHHSRAFGPFIRLLDEYCPRSRAPNAILLENVLGLLTSEGGKDLARVIRSVNELGYRCDIVVVDAKWFVPQSRPRVFIERHTGG